MSPVSRFSSINEINKVIVGSVGFLMAKVRWVGSNWLSPIYRISRARGSCGFIRSAG